MDNNFKKLVTFVKNNNEKLRVNDKQKLKIFASELNRYMQNQIMAKDQTNFELYFGKEKLQEYEERIISLVRELLMTWVLIEPPSQLNNF